MTNESEAMEVWRERGTEPAACHVLAAWFDSDCGEWACAVVATPLCQPFTHWRMLDTPDSASVIATALEARDARIAELEGALTDAAANGLIYWEPITARGITAKAAMLDRIDAILTKQEKTHDQ